MKFHRAAVIATATLIAAACSGDEPVAAPETTAAPAPTVTTTIVTTTTAAPTTAPTTTAPVETIPESLAFAPTRDIGRLYEVDGSVSLLDGPGGASTGQISDGTLVQAAAAREQDSVLYVAIIDPNDQSVLFGWVEPSELRPTTQFVTTTDSSVANQLGQVGSSPGEDSLNIVSSPGGSSVVGNLSDREMVTFTGTAALAGDGGSWREIATPGTGEVLGWIPFDNWIDVRGNSARTQDFRDSDQRMSSSVTYGAPLPNIAVSVVACNAVQIEIPNTSNTTGMAFVFGSEIPSAVVGASLETWRGSSVYVEPGGSTTLTLLNTDPTTWYFASLDAQGRAEAPRTVAGDLVGDDGTRVLATAVQQVAVPAGACGFVPELGLYELEQLLAEEAARESELAEAEAAASAEEGDDEGVGEDETIAADSGEQDGAVQETPEGNPVEIVPPASDEVADASADQSTETPATDDGAQG